MLTAKRVTDFLIFLLPMPVVWSIRLPRRQKYILSAVFGFGFMCAPPTPILNYPYYMHPLTPPPKPQSLLHLHPPPPAALPRPVRPRLHLRRRRALLPHRRRGQRRHRLRVCRRPQALARPLLSEVVGQLGGGFFDEFFGRWWCWGEKAVGASRWEEGE